MAFFPAVGFVARCHRCRRFEPLNTFEYVGPIAMNRAREWCAAHRENQHCLGMQGPIVYRVVGSAGPNQWTVATYLDHDMAGAHCRAAYRDRMHVHNRHDPNRPKLGHSLGAPKYRVETEPLSLPID